MGRPLALVALLIVLQVNQSDCLKCYTCGEPHHTLQQGGGDGGGNAMSCREFDAATDDERALERFVIECPSEFVSCTTQKQGNQVSRNCDTLQIDDCQVANGVTYCFCTHDLCNGKMSEVSPASPPTEPHHHQVTDLEHTIDLSDDEDYTEMSGNGSNEEDHMKEASEEIAVEAPFNGINNETRESSTESMDETPYMNYPPPPSPTKISGCHRSVADFGLIVLLYGLVVAALL